MDQKHEISLIISGKTTAASSSLNSGRQINEENQELSLYGFHSPRNKQSKLLTIQKSKNSKLSRSQEPAYAANESNSIIVDNYEKLDILSPSNMGFQNNDDKKICNKKQMKYIENNAIGLITDASTLQSNKKLKDDIENGNQRLYGDRNALGDITNITRVDSSKELVNFQLENRSSYKKTPIINSCMENVEAMQKEIKDEIGCDSPYFLFDQGIPLKSPKQTSKSSERVKELSKIFKASGNKEPQNATLWREPSPYNHVLKVGIDKDMSKHNPEPLIDQDFNMARKKPNTELELIPKQKKIEKELMSFDSNSKPPRMSTKPSYRGLAAENEQNSRIDSLSYQGNNPKYSEMSFRLEFEKEKVAQLEEKLIDTEQTIQSIKNSHKIALRAIEEKNENLQKCKEEKDKKIEKLIIKLNEYKQKNCLNNKEKSDLYNELQNLKGLLQEKDAKIFTLESMISKRKNQELNDKSRLAHEQEDLKVRLEQLTEENSKLNRTNNQLNDHIKELNIQMNIQAKHYNNEVEELRREIEKITSKIARLTSSSKDQPSSYQIKNDKPGGYLSNQSSCYPTVDISPSTGVSKQILDDLAKEFESSNKNQDVPLQIKFLIQFKKQAQRFIDALNHLLFESSPTSLEFHGSNLDKLYNIIHDLLEENKFLKKTIHQFKIDGNSLIQEIMTYLNVDSISHVIPKIKELTRGISIKHTDKKFNIYVDTIETNGNFSTEEQSNSYCSKQLLWCFCVFAFSKKKVQNQKMLIQLKLQYFWDKLAS